MRVGVLGATQAWLDGSAVDLGTLKQRAVLAALGLYPGQPVSPDALVDLVWGAAPPVDVTASLQAYVARLRRALEPGRAPRASAQVVVTVPGGYALRVDRAALDAARFEDEVTAVHDRVAVLSPTEPAGVAPDELDDLGDRLVAALALWRGTPYAELEATPGPLAARGRLEELRLLALEDHAVVELARGQHGTVAARLEPLVQQHPVRERLWALRALALARSGRQADALDALRQARAHLAEELGLEPGAELRDLQAAVLRQDPALTWRAPARAPLAPGRAPDRAERELVGRDAQLAALVEELHATPGRPGLAVLTGEPGIGKTRLAGELAARAREAGVRVLVGRCSQDEGAPPLWPWAAVLRGLGRDLPSVAAEDAEDPTRQFRAWEQIVEAVRSAAREEPVLVVLDDLHWADTSTLRVLRLLVETADAERLTVLTTWRADPAPTGVLAEVAEVLARQHALRLSLAGLDADDVRRLVASVAEATPSADQADALRRRTDGNPFFLVEYARLAQDGGDLEALLAESDPPAAVQDVLARRVAALPEATATTLRAACVGGRHFDVVSLATVLDRPEDDVLDDLEPAREAGLLREDGVDHFRFAHALVRDTLYGAVSRSRSARVHARFAEALEGRPGRETEVARHWLQAGEHRARDAWRACVLAARSAQRVFAHEEAAALLRDAVGALDLDPGASLVEQHDLLMEYAVALQRAGNWVDLRPTVHRAIRVADELDDLDRLVDAATVSLDGALWQASVQNELDPVIVAALRRALDRLPPGDGAARCRVMVALAGEIYYAATPLEREALVEEAVAMARRLDDRALLLWTCLTGPTSIWRAANAGVRFELLDEACALAAELDDPTSLSVAHTLRTVAHGELGRVVRMEEELVGSRRLAEGRRHRYAELVLDALELPWRAMRDEDEAVGLLLAHMTDLGSSVLLPMYEQTVTGSLAMRLLWTEEYAALGELLTALEQASTLPVRPFHTAVMCRAGRVQDARAHLEGFEVDEQQDTWFSPLVWAMLAETALHLGRSDLAAPSYAWLSPLAGLPASTGSAAAFGPVDAFLALAAATTGQRELATQHAEDALRLCEEWRIPLVARWLTGLRASHDF